VELSRGRRRQELRLLTRLAPGIKGLAHIKDEQVSNVGSQDMTLAIMLTLAKRINELLAQNDVDGIVVTHGTDTMEETAFFLNLVVKSEKPVVLVGSMRPSTAVSAGGPLNLFDAVGVAADPKTGGRGVLVVMNDWIHAAHSLTKTSTTATQTFMSPCVAWWAFPAREKTISITRLAGNTQRRASLTWLMSPGCLAWTFYMPMPIWPRI